ncbi:hypothetical protein Tco_0891554 [Tanacetum coccineum]|uniref:Uncharacterized protein n=1 Tax=Tanacetum coccineum TaxID=301880 RepID=A0ABQ5C661_9ASTR
MYKVVQKLRRLKKPFRKLLFNTGNIHENVKNIRHELDRVQRDLDLDPFNDILREEEVVSVQAFNEAVLLEERFLRQKAKINWLKEGVANSAYFHKAVKTFNFDLDAAVLTCLAVLIDVAALREVCLAALTGTSPNFVATVVGTKFLLGCG